MESLNGEDLVIPSPITIQVYKGFSYLFMMINFGLCTTTTVAILKTPATYLTIYRYYLLHEVLWAFLFDVAIFSFIPIVHLPHICYQSGGLLGTTLSNYGNYYFLYVFTILCAGKAYSQFLCIFHRYVLAHRHRSRYGSILNYLARFGLPWTPVFYYGFFVSCIMIIWVALFFFSGNPQEITHYLQHVDVDVHQVLLHFPKMTCMIQRTSSYKFVLLCPVLLLAVWGIGMAFLVGSMAYALRTDKHTFTTTLRLQWMLFRSLVAQLGMTLVFMYFPVLIWFLVGYFDGRYEMVVGIVAISMLAMHSSVDCMVILVYVRPFRVAIRRLFFGDVKVESLGSRTTRSRI